MPVTQNYAHRTFGRITLSAPVPGKTGYWKGTCSCGSPVEKRIDNLKRPGGHACGMCPTPSPAADADLEGRVRRLERIVASIDPDFLSGATLAPAAGLTPSATGGVRGSPPQPLTSRFSQVTYDAEGELWEARALSGKAFFWGTTEEEAALAARIYLGLIHCALNNRTIADAELTLPEGRRDEIRFEVSEGL